MTATLRTNQWERIRTFAKTMLVATGLLMLVTCWLLHMRPSVLLAICLAAQVVCGGLQCFILHVSRKYDR